LVNCWDQGPKPDQDNIDRNGGVPVWYINHVPRTGTCSAYQELKNARIDGHRYYSGEFCFNEIPKVGVIMQMYRHPHSHVLSQFFECVNSTSWPWAADAKEKMPDFWTWVEAWGTKQADGRAAGHHHYHTDPYKCYRPIDMQSHRLTCDEWHIHADQIDLKKAIENVKETVPGIMEAWTETQCVWQQRILEQKDMRCDCRKGNYKQIRGKEAIQMTHGVKHPPVEAYPASVWDAVDQITKNDLKVYKAAVKEFTAVARGMEVEYNQKLLCNWDERFGWALKDD
jgi:hypothetical protein